MQLVTTVSLCIIVRAITNITTNLNVHMYVSLNSTIRNEQTEYDFLNASQRFYLFLIFVIL